MNQGELIQMVRLHDRQVQILEEMLVAMQKRVDELDEMVQSPIRREIYATRKRVQQKGS